MSEFFDFKYGLIVVDQEGISPDFYNVLHFIGFTQEPTEEDIESARIELENDEEFELTEYMDMLDIVVAPPHIVEYFKQVYSDNYKSIRN